MAKPKNSNSPVDAEANEGLVDESYDTTNSDPQADANADRDQNDDASANAADRGAESGDVDAVKAEEDQTQDTDALLAEGRKRRTSTDGDKEDESKKRDEEQKAALKRAYGDALHQPVEDDRVKVQEVRKDVDAINKDWTVQSGRPFLAGPSGEVGQAFVKAQLPNREVQKQAGIDPDQWAAGVVVLDDDHATEDIYSGPEPSEARNLGLL